MTRRRKSDPYVNDVAWMPSVFSSCLSQTPAQASRDCKPSSWNRPRAITRMRANASSGFRPVTPSLGFAISSSEAFLRRCEMIFRLHSNTTSTATIACGPSRSRTQRLTRLRVSATSSTSSSAGCSSARKAGLLRLFHNSSRISNSIRTRLDIFRSSLNTGTGFRGSTVCLASS
eukprot:Rmarinus@m.25992